MLIFLAGLVAGLCVAVGLGIVVGRRLAQMSTAPTASVNAKLVMPDNACAILNADDPVRRLVIHNQPPGDLP